MERAASLLNRVTQVGYKNEMKEQIKKINNLTKIIEC